jgi:hypothetical protein
MKRWFITLLLFWLLPLPSFAAVDRYQDALDWLSKDSQPRNFSERSIDLTGTRLSVYDPILEILEAFHRQDAAELFPEFQDVCSMQSNSQDPSLCREIATPLTAYKDREAPEISDATMTTVEGLLAAVLTVGTKTEWPSAIKKVAWVRRLENLVRKVRYDEFQKRLDTVLAHSALASGERAELIEAQRFLLKFGKEAAPRGLRHLPYPLLSKQDRIALSMFLGGVLWRFRGAGGYDDMGTRDRRRYFARGPFEALARLNGASAAFSHQLGWSTWFGLMQSWGRFHDIGRLNDSVASDFAEMKNRGEFAARFTSRLVGVYGFSSGEMKAAGLQMASCYYYGWEGIDNTVKVGSHLTSPYLFIIGAPSNFGELCTGAALATGLAKTLLIHE